MSRTDEGRSPDAALLDLVEKATSTTTRADETSRVYDDARDAALPTKPWPPRPVSATRIALSQKAHPRPYNDPSNYLG